MLPRTYITEKRADHSLRDEQGSVRPRSFLCAVAPMFSVDVGSWQHLFFGCNKVIGRIYLKVILHYSVFVASLVVDPPYNPDRPPLMVKGLYYNRANKIFIEKKMSVQNHI